MGLESLAERVFDITVVRAARRIDALGKMAKHVVQRVPVRLGPAYAARMKYEDMREIFIRNGQHGRYDRSVRDQLVTRFERIDREVKILTTPTDGLFLAEAILSLECDGAIVECGCFNGGSTAKLSIVAKAVGREVVVFDSFEGLPHTGSDESTDTHARQSSAWLTDWTPGRYAAQLDVVRATVERYGEISACTFVKGWFKDTLNDANLPARVALAFTDVDLASSARDCLTALWPRMAEGGVFFSHDIAFIKVLQGLTDERLWTERLRAPVPIIFGAGYGLCDASPHLGFFVKGKELTPEYLKSIMLEK